MTSLLLPRGLRLFCLSVGVHYISFFGHLSLTILLLNFTNHINCFFSISTIMSFPTLIISFILLFVIFLLKFSSISPEHFSSNNLFLLSLIWIFASYLYPRQADRQMWGASVCPDFSCCPDSFPMVTLEYCMFLRGSWTRMWGDWSLPHKRADGRKDEAVTGVHHYVSPRRGGSSATFLPFRQWSKEPPLTHDKSRLPVHTLHNIS